MMSYFILHATDYEELWERFEKIAGEVSRCQIISKTKLLKNVTESIAHDTWLNGTLVLNES